ncbi:MAG: hypothetical protein MUE40_16260 [Anaerolineae bacterium]|nr:hypothetical protein [Anaerolineae bacterium]
MKLRQMLRPLCLASLLLAFALPAAAQDMMMSPMVTVSDQVSLDGTVTIAEVYSEGPGFVVVHAEQDGSVGPVAGYRQVNPGLNYNVRVPLDAALVTPNLYAMLHVDTGAIGVYEFGTVEGADGPAMGDMMMVNPPFKVEFLHAHDQIVTANTVTIAHITTAQDGFVVIHDGDATSFGPVLGYAPISAGMNMDVVVTLDSAPTMFVWPMLHVDTGTAGTYEFGTVEGADGPVVVNGVVATAPIVVGAPAMRAESQIVTDTVMIDSVSSQGPGFVVIHADNAGAPGEVIGFAPVSDGISLDVAVTVDAARVTPVLFPMLHADTGTVGTYEFGEVEGEDLPQAGSSGSALFFPIMAKPGIMYNGSLSEGVLTIDAALIDVPGFMVIHADNGGAPGPVLGYTPLLVGLNQNIAVTLAAEGLTETVFPMLHVDTGEAGVYEFGQVEGADGPVRVNDVVVTGPLTPTMGE